MARNWTGVWEKVLSIMLTANIAVMGWLWSNVARLADKLDRHCEERAIHQGVDVGELVWRREFDAARDSGRAVESGIADRVTRLEEKVDRIAMRRIGDGE